MSENEQVSPIDLLIATLGIGEADLARGLAIPADALPDWKTSHVDLVRWQLNVQCRGVYGLYERFREAGIHSVRLYDEAEAMRGGWSSARLANAALLMCWVLLSEDRRPLTILPFREEAT